MDEVEGHRRRRPDELVKPVNKSGERRYTDDTEWAFRGGVQSGCRGWRRSSAAASSIRTMYARTASPRARRGTTKWRSSGRALFKSSTIKSPPCASTAFSKRSTAESRSTSSSGCSAPVMAMPRPRSRARTSAAADVRSSNSSSLAIPILLVSILREAIVRIAIQPPLPRLRRGDHRMPARPRVLAGVAVGRAVAAQCGAALLAGAQMHPLRFHLHALGALAALGVLYGLDDTEMRAGTVRHSKPRLLVQYLVYGGDRDRSLAHGRGHALQAPRADVPDREDPGETRLEEMRSTGQRPACGGQILGQEVRSRLDEPLGVECQAAVQPARAGHRARHGEDMPDTVRLDTPVLAVAPGHAPEMTVALPAH